MSPLVLSGSQGSLRGYIVRALTEVRRAQVRIRVARSRLEALNDVEGVVRLEALNEVLERVALRLETLLVLGVASSELLRASLVAVRVLELLKQYAPPDVRHLVAEIQQALERIHSMTVSSKLLEASPRIDSSDVEDVLREAIEVAKARLESRGVKPVK